MEWRCHTFRQCRGQLGFDGPAKALLLPVTVRALQIGNPEEIICKEHVFWWCRIQPSQERGDEKKPESKQPGTKRIKAFQLAEYNQEISRATIPNSTQLCLQFSHETLPKECNIAQVIYCVMCSHSACLSGASGSRLADLQTKTLHLLTSAGMLSFARFPEYLLEHVGQIALPEGI